MRVSQPGTTVAGVGGQPITRDRSSSTRNAMPNLYAMNCAGFARVMPRSSTSNHCCIDRRFWIRSVGGCGRTHRGKFVDGRPFPGRSRTATMSSSVGLDAHRSNVWRYPGANSFARHGEEGNLLDLHPTVKPVAMVADAILDCSARGDIVLDAFLGSGTTVIAAE